MPPDPSYGNVNRPWGGLNVNTGTGCKFINLVIHDNSQGVSWWTPSKDSELYGCLIYDNGWAGTDRGHGHAIYTQNADGTKTIADCIMTGGHGYTLHAYGSSRADVDNYLVAGNIAYAANTFLIGGGKPSHHIRVHDNILHGVRMQLGYWAPRNEDCEVRDNVVVDAGLRINRFEQVAREGNLVLAKGDAGPKGLRGSCGPTSMIPGGPTWPCSTGRDGPRWKSTPASSSGPASLPPAGPAGRLRQAGAGRHGRRPADPRAGGGGVRRVRPDQGRRGGTRAMNRREMFTAAGVLPLASLAGREAGPEALPTFWTSRLSDVDRAVGWVEKGKAPCWPGRPAGGPSTWSPTARPSTAGRPPITTRRAAG